MAHFLSSLHKTLLADIERTRAKLEYFRSIVNVDLTAEFIEQQEGAVRAKLKYLQAYTTVVRRIKTRADDFIKGNFDSLREQSAIVDLFHSKQKQQLHQLIQMTSLRTARNPHF